MKPTSKILVAILVVCGLLFQLSPVDVHRRGDEVNPNAEQQTETPGKSTPAQDISIYINDDGDWLDQGATGTGTEGNPYVIEGRSISRSDECVTIRSTRAHFVIRFCTFVTDGYYDSCIRLINVTNGKIRNCAITSHLWDAISVENSENITVITNTITAEVVGAEFEESNNIVFQENQIYPESHGLVLTECLHCEVTDNQFFGPGILLNEFLSYSSLNYTYWNHTFAGNEVRGQAVGYLRGLTDTVVNGLDYAQLFVFDCENLTIDGGSFIDVPTGFEIVNCRNATISGASTLNTTRDGTIVNSINVTVEQCSFEDTYYGLTIRDSVNCTVRDIHTSGDNPDSISRSYGFAFFNCTDCLGINNYAEDQANLASLRESSDCVITNCTAYCGYGFYLYGCTRIDLTENSITASAGGFSSMNSALQMTGCSNIMIAGNSISAPVTLETVEIYSCNNITMQANEILGAIRFEMTSYVLFDHNNLTSPEPAVLELFYNSYYYNITNNQLEGMSFVFEVWNYEEWTFILENNTIDGKPVIVIENEVGTYYSEARMSQAFIVSSRDVIIENTTIDNARVGIKIFNSTVTIRNATASECGAIVVDAYKSSVNISDCIFVGGINNVRLFYCWDCSIADSELVDGRLSMYNVTNIIVNNSLIVSDVYTTFYCGQLANSTISHCLLSGETNDLQMYDCVNVTVASNAFLGSSTFSVIDSRNLTVINNDLGGTRLDLEGMLGIECWIHFFENNTMDIGPLGYFSGLSNQVLSIDGYPQVVVAACNNIGIVTTTGGPVLGLTLGFSTNCTLSDLVQNYYAHVYRSNGLAVVDCDLRGGLLLEYSHDCTVQDSDISDSYLAAWACDNLSLIDSEITNSNTDFSYTDGLKIRCCNITATPSDGLYISSSENVTISEINTVTAGIQLHSCANVLLTMGQVYDSNYFGIFIDGCYNTTVMDFLVTESTYSGIRSYHSSYVILVSNRIYDSEDPGIYLDVCDNAFVSGNALGWNAEANGKDDFGENNVWDSNYWAGLGTRVEYEVPGNTQVVDYSPIHLSARDYGPPIISGLEDTYFWSNDTAAQLVWEAYDANPTTYEIFVNGSLTRQSIWMSTAFFINFADYDVGFYNVTMKFYDIFDDYTIGQVIVEIRESAGEGTARYPWEAIIAAGAVSASFVAVAVIFAKRRVAKSASRA